MSRHRRAAGLTGERSGDPAAARPVPPREVAADARARALWACQEHARAALECTGAGVAGAQLEVRLAAIANQFWPFYEFSAGTRDRVAAKLRRERPLTALAWAAKVALALLVAYPGHVAMGEMLGYRADYTLGFKAYLTTWPIVTALLLAAELLIITGTVELRLAGDARDYLYKGFNPGHYDRGYLYRRYEETAGKRRLGWTCFVIASVLALADLAFNVVYMWDMTGQAALAALAGGFFTALLVGLSVLLAHTYEYHHIQLADARKASEHIQAGGVYVPFAPDPAPPGPERASVEPEAVLPEPQPVEAEASAVLPEAPPDQPEPRPVLPEPPPDQPEPRPILADLPPDQPEPRPILADLPPDQPEQPPVPEPLAMPAEPPVAPSAQPAPRKRLPPPTQLRALEGGPSFLLHEENRVGRDRSNSVVLRDPTVADFHARLDWNGRTWEIEDLGSKHGTHLKGSRLPERQPTPVSVGTAVRFGACELFLDVHIGLPR